MSTENLNDPAFERELKKDEPPIENSTVRNKRNFTPLYLALIVLLAAACAYLYFSRKDEVKAKEQVVAEKGVVVIEKDQLQDEFNAASAKLDAMVSENEQLRKEVNASNSKVARLRSEFKVIMAKESKTEEDYEQARKLIAQINDKVSIYEKRIAELETANRKLNDKIGITTAERDASVSERQELQKLASVLHVSNIQMIPIDLRRGGRKEKETSKARKADLLRIIFDIDENRIAESGSHELYLRITSPEGNLLSNAAYGSGVTTSNDGNQIGYTLSKTVELVQNQPLKGIVINWKQESDYKSGDYRIEVYNEGFKVGFGTVKLR